MLNIKSNYEFKYGLADDSNLILSDCVFEFINFNNENNNCELYIKLEKLYMQNLMQCIINTHFFNIMFNNNFGNFINNNKINYEDLFKRVNNSRRKNKYTKLLQIKTNRMKDKKEKIDNKKEKLK